jgi:carboxypeptidase Q
MGTALFGLVTDSQRYFDYHHSPNDSFEHVNQRELQLGSFSIAALVYLIDEHGL